MKSLILSLACLLCLTGCLHVPLPTFGAAPASGQKTFAATATEAMKAATPESHASAPAPAGFNTTWLFVLGSIVSAAGVAALIFGQGIPFLGPLAGKSIVAGGLSLIGIGLAVNFVQAHPLILWIPVALLSVAAGLMLANHYHEIERKLLANLSAVTPAPSPIPAA